MGYTHYWQVNIKTDSTKLAAAQYDMHLILQNAKTPLANGLAEEGSSPTEEEGYLAFNGVGDDGHEAFAWPPRRTEGFTPGYGFEFCKTARKPYDAVVGACLIVAKSHLGEDIKVFSDGSEEEFLHGAAIYHIEDETAAKLYERTFGIPATSPLENEEV